jgi:hypothetical protein
MDQQATRPQPLSTTVLRKEFQNIFFLLTLFWIVFFVNQFVHEIFKDIVILFAFGITIYLTYAILEYWYTARNKKRS